MSLRGLCEEAKITHVEESELKRKFGKFCRKAALHRGVEGIHMATTPLKKNLSK